MTLSVLTIISLPIALVLFVLIFVTLNRYIRYKERVALAQLGLPPDASDWQDRARSHGSRGVLWGGVITATSGLAILLGLGTLGMGVWLIAGFLPLFVGLGMILIYFLTPGTGPSADSVEPGEEQMPRQPLAFAGNGTAPHFSPRSPDHDGDQPAVSEPARPGKASRR